MRNPETPRQEIKEKITKEIVLEVLTEGGCFIVQEEFTGPDENSFIVLVDRKGTVVGDVGGGGGLAEIFKDLKDDGKITQTSTSEYSKHFHGKALIYEISKTEN